MSVGSKKMTSEEYSEFRADVARRTNKARGLSDDVQNAVKDLYFTQGYTAKSVAKILGVSHGSVRSTISRAYANMSFEERTIMGKNSGKWKRGDE